MNIVIFGSFRNVSKKVSVGTEICCTCSLYEHLLINPANAAAAAADDDDDVKNHHNRLAWFPYTRKKVANSRKRFAMA